MTFEFENLEIGFHKCQVSFLLVKTVKCKSGITLSILCKLMSPESSSYLNLSIKIKYQTKHNPGLSFNQLQNTKTVKTEWIMAQSISSFFFGIRLSNL